jgi:hypothetical protein
VSTASGFLTRPLSRAGLGVLLRATWLAVRWPLLAVLVILEPIIRLLLASSALLLALTALFFVLVRSPATFPFWGILGVSTGLVLALTLYYATLRVLSA